MPRYSVSFEAITPELLAYLAFLGYDKARESDDFVVLTDKYLEDHLIWRARPSILVEDMNDAVCLKGFNVTDISDGYDD